MAVGNQNTKKTPVWLSRLLVVLIVFALCSLAEAAAVCTIPDWVDFQRSWKWKFPILRGISQRDA
jgi:hypothetical protein